MHVARRGGRRHSESEREIIQHTSMSSCRQFTKRVQHRDAVPRLHAHFGAALRCHDAPPATERAQWSLAPDGPPPLLPWAPHWFPRTHVWDRQPQNLSTNSALF